MLLVDPATLLGPISPYLLGSNHGPWIGLPAEMLPAAYESGVKAVRFPGGAWGDRNELKSYHIDAFIGLTEQMGAIATISTNLREGTPEQAADLVRYTNIEKGYGVAYWSIGNEPSLFAAELQVVDKMADYDTERFNREWRESAVAMKEVDPDIKLMGPEVHQFSHDSGGNPKDSSGRDWMVEFLKANGDMVDVVTFHRYPFPRGGARVSATIEDLRQHSREWEQTIVYLNGLIEELTGRAIPIALTEVNTHWTSSAGGEATPDSHYNAIWVAEMLGRLMRKNLLMVNHWMLTSHGSSGGWGLIGRGELRPSYYVYQLYDKFGSERVHAESGVDDVSVYAARAEDGTLTLLIINLADTEKQVTLQLLDQAPPEAELWRLDPDQLPVESSRFKFPAGGELSLPMQSVTLLAVSQQ
jgi:hypothetical protein